MGRLGLGLTILVFLLAGPASAEHPGKIQARLGGGIAVPTSPDAFTDGWNTGFNATGGFQIGVSPVLDLAIDFIYNRFGLDKSYVTGGYPGVSIDGGAVSVTYLSGSLVVKPMANSPGVAKIYMRFGVGFHHLSISDATVSGGLLSIPVSGDSESNFGLNAGLGLQVQKLFVEASYIIGFTEGDSTSHFPIIIGLVFDLGPGL